MHLPLILALIQAGRMTLDLAERYGKGELTSDEARAEWQALSARVIDANEMWESATGDRGDGDEPAV